MTTYQPELFSTISIPRKKTFCRKSEIQHKMLKKETHPVLCICMYTYKKNVPSALQYNYVQSNVPMSHMQMQIPHANPKPILKIRLSFSQTTVTPSQTP